jgi:hypothetical protein
MTDKPSNPEVLDETGIALLKTLKFSNDLFYWNYSLDWQGEPLFLPSSYYREEPFPSGLSICGWRLTQEGIDKWTELHQ